MPEEVLSGLHFELNEEQQIIKESVNEFVGRHVAPGVMERDKNHEFPHDIIKMLVEQGFLGMIHDSARSVAIKIKLNSMKGRDDVLMDVT